MLTIFSTRYLNGMIQWVVNVFVFLLPWPLLYAYHKPFLNGSSWEYGVLGFYATELLLWSGMGLFFLFSLLVWRKKIVPLFSWLRDRRGIFFSLLLVVYEYVSVSWSLYPVVAFQHALRVMLAFLLFFLLTSGIVRYEKMIGWFLAGSTLQSLLGMYQFLTQRSVIFRGLGLVPHEAAISGTVIVGDATIGRFVRAYGALPHPNVFGGYIVLSFVLLVWYFLTRPQPSRGRIVVYWLLWSVHFTALFFSFSRSAFLAAAIFFLSVWLYTKKEPAHFLRRFLVYSVVLGVCLTSIYLPLIRIRTATASPYEARSVTERLRGVDEAMTVFRAHPWRGVGLANYTAVLQARRPGYLGVAYQPVHNVPLLLLTEYGLVGIGLIFCLVWVFVHENKKTRKQKSTVFLFFCFFVFLPLALFDHYLFSSYIGLMLTALWWSAAYSFHPHRAHSSSTVYTQRGLM